MFVVRNAVINYVTGESGSDVIFFVRVAVNWIPCNYHAKDEVRATPRRATKKSKRYIITSPTDENFECRGIFLRIFVKYQS